MCNLAIENEQNYNIKVSDFEIKNKIEGSTATVLMNYTKIMIIILNLLLECIMLTTYFNGVTIKQH